ncbi:MAG: hypothetical protein IJZ62_00930 [Clostridia bacterium]|nr:hypothetical protein [Clostridia bacterium]
MIGEFRDEQQREVLVQRLGVFELRALAREIGIPSPTTKKRDELVAMIMQSFEKGVSQEAKVQKRGRPYKKLNSLDEIIGSVIDDNKSEMNYESVIALAQEEKPVAIMQGEITRLEGICRVSDKNVTLHTLIGNDVVFVSDIYGIEKLENGDLVEVTAQRINENSYKALSISLINGQSAVSFQRKEYPLGEEVISGRTITCGNRKIVDGRRNACLLKEDLYENDELKQLKDFCDKNNIKLVIVGTNTSFENQIMFKGLNVKYNFTTPYDSNARVNLNKTIDGLNFADNCLKNGEDVMLIVADLGGLLLGLDENFDKESDKHSKETEIITKKMLSLAGAFDSGKSLTLVMYYSDVDSADKFITYDLLRVCKKS